MAGKFSFIQTGMIPLTSRLLGGPTREPREQINCVQNVSDFSVCDENQRQIEIDVVKCVSMDSDGREIDLHCELPISVKNLHNFVSNPLVDFKFRYFFKL